MSEKRSLLKSAGVVGSITLLSRMLGLVRDAIIAARLGAGFFSDCFNIAFEIPNLTRRVLGEGALSAFIVPVYSRARKEDTETHGWRFVSNAINIFFIVTLIMTFLGIIFSKELFIAFGGIKFFAKGETEYINLGVGLTRIMFPYLIFMTIGALLMGILHAHRHFSTPTFGSVTMNVTIIVGGLLYAHMAQRPFTFVLAWAVAIAGILRVAIMIPPLLSRGFHYFPVFKPKSPHMRSLFKMMIPATIGLAVVEINVSVDANFANFLGPGRITCLRYANQIIQFPLALFAASIGTAILPQISHLLLEGKKKELGETVSFAFRLLMIIFIPATAGLIFLGQPIVEVILQRGRWTAEASYNTNFALTFYALSLVPVSFLRLITPVYYARENVMAPFKASLIGLASNICLNTFFILFTPLEQGGLALATAIADSINFYILYRGEKELFGPAFIRAVRRTFYPTLAASICMGLGAWALHKELLQLHPADHFVLKAAYLLISVGAGLGLYVFFGRIFRIPEMNRAIRLLLKRK